MRFMKPVKSSYCFASSSSLASARCENIPSTSIPSRPNISSTSRAKSSVGSEPSLWKPVSSFTWILVLVPSSFEISDKSLA